MGFFDRFRAPDASNYKPIDPTLRSPLERDLIKRLQTSLNDGNEPLRLHLLFSGTVQGVGFRWTNQGVANQLNLTGWVKNLRDGKVELEVQGTPAAIIKHLDGVHSYYNHAGYEIRLDEEHELPLRTGEDTFDVHF